MIKEDSKILHFFDDDKFIDPAIKLFESVIPNYSVYYVLKKEGESFKYVNSNKAIPLDIDNLGKINALIDDKDNKIVFFHALNSTKQQLACKFSDNVVKVWFIWGYDLYNNWKILKKNLFEKETKGLAQKYSFKQSLKNTLFFNKYSFSCCCFIRPKLHLFPKFIANFINNNYFTQFYKAAEKIDVVVPVVPDEYELLKTLKIKSEFAPFTYGCLEDMVQHNFDTILENKHNILVGNSGYESNNHIDVFKKLSNLKLGKRKIYVPLSYGGSPKYIELVILKGKQYFGDNFKPLLDFMPLDDYNKIIASCGVIVFNHVRQQALGNIIPLGYQGAKLFLNHKSPVYSYFKKEGIHIFNFNELNQKAVDVLLDENQFKNNQEIFYKIYSNKSVKNKIKILLTIVSLKLNEKVLDRC